MSTRCLLIFCVCHLVLWEMVFNFIIEGFYLFGYFFLNCWTIVVYFIQKGEIKLHFFLQCIKLKLNWINDPKISHKLCNYIWKYRRFILGIWQRQMNNFKSNPETQGTKKVNKWVFIKLEIFCSPKETLNHLWLLAMRSFSWSFSNNSLLV